MIKRLGMLIYKINEIVSEFIKWYLEIVAGEKIDSKSHQNNKT
jgi:hypothetical protein